MSFVNAPGIKGQLFVPEGCGNIRKHGCRDCFCCQMCSEDRCSLCMRKSAIDVDTAVEAAKEKEDKTGR